MTDVLRRASWSASAAATDSNARRLSVCGQIILTTKPKRFVTGPTSDKICSEPLWRNRTYLKYCWTVTIELTNLWIIIIWKLFSDVVCPVGVYVCTYPLRCAALSTMVVTVVFLVPFSYVQLAGMKICWLISVI